MRRRVNVGGHGLYQTSISPSPLLRKYQIPTKNENLIRSRYVQDLICRHTQPCVVDTGASSSRNHDLPMEYHPTVRRWLADNDKRRDDPPRTRYYSRHVSNPESLISTTRVHNIVFGTGESIYTNTVLPAIEQAEHEVILVTCFWARSRTLDHLNDTLRDLSDKALRSREGRKIRVRICFSSSSLWQKLFHTSSLNGRTYAPSEWHTKVGLPQANELQGLDVQVKSIFVLPFSVMHPKFVIIDRSHVLLPSCNVSWENWFEGCIELSGQITEHLVDFWARFWAGEGDLQHEFDSGSTDVKRRPLEDVQTTPMCLLGAREIGLENVPSIFLPSPHHRNPQFALPWNTYRPPPSTPLNTFLLSAFANAKQEIYVQTPNLTSPPVLSAMLAALRRGVDVRILTSERLMILEQLVTAGTTTRRCVKKLLRRHGKLVQSWQGGGEGSADIEAGGIVRPGALRVSFYQAKADTSDKDAPEPVQSHLKLTIIDGEWTIFGSGNMDRASWYTSQELGVAFFSPLFAAEVRSCIDTLMRPRSREA